MTSPRNELVPVLPAVPSCPVCQGTGRIEFQQPVPQPDGTFHMVTVRHPCTRLCAGEWEGWTPPNAGRSPGPGLPPPIAVGGHVVGAGDPTPVIGLRES